jgi:hypothetical protein
MENPPTGQRVIPYLLGYGVGTGMLEMGHAAGAGALSALLTTKTGQNLLLTASKLKPGTVAMDRLSARISDTLARGAGAQTVDGGSARERFSNSRTLWGEQ